MALDVTIFIIPGHPRSHAVCHAMREGISKCGDTALIKSSLRYNRPDSRVAVFYGLANRLPRVLADYSSAPQRTALYTDLGYWGRKDGGRFAGFHKLSINDRHPTAYFQNRKHDDSRIKPFGLTVSPWQSGGRHILVAGMGPKGALAEGFQPTEWERRTIAELRKHTDRPIIYRPKPNWDTARGIPGAELSKGRDLAEDLAGAHAVVSHHSNTCVEALLAGVPIFTEQGVSLPMGLSDLSKIEDPARPDGRRQWLADLGWVQWSVEEMAAGLPWRHLKDEGVIA